MAGVSDCGSLAFTKLGQSSVQSRKDHQVLIPRARLKRLNDGRCMRYNLLMGYCKVTDKGALTEMLSMAALAVGQQYLPRKLTQKNHPYPVP